MSENRWHAYIKTTAANAPIRGDMSVADYAHRLQWNENPYDFPEDLKEEAMTRFAERAWARYPTEFRPRELIAALAAQANVAPEMIAIAAGSSALIQSVLGAVLEPGDHMVTPSPTFLLYRREALVLGAELHQIATSAETGFALPVDDLIVCARTNEAKLIALCAPNNPTGTIYAGDDLRRIADEAGALLVIDEAYREFCGQDLRPLLDEFENVILLRTFSKAYALAGLRIGYALAAPPLITAMENVSPPFPITVFSAIAAEVALDHASRFQNQVGRVVAERERLAGAMSTLSGVTVFPSGANFLLVRFDRAPDSIVRALRDERNLLISDAGGYPELSNCLRISVGTPEENDWVLAAVRDFVDGRLDA